MHFSRSVCVLLIAGFLSVAVTAEEDCEALVDMADSADIEDFHNCTESGGLNGFLQRAMKKSQAKDRIQSTYRSTETKTEIAPKAKLPPAEMAVQLPAKPPEMPAGKVSPEDSVVLPSEPPSLASKRPAFKLPGDLEAQKSQLILKIAGECPEGFVLEGEEYRPAANGLLSLNLKYHCL